MIPILDITYISAYTVNHWPWICSSYIRVARMQHFKHCSGSDTFIITPNPYLSHCSSATSFMQGIGGMLPMMLVLAFMYSVCMTIKSLVLEKELRLKEVLRAVGIQNGALWAARFTENIVLLTVPCVLISVMVKVSGKESLNSKYVKHKAESMETTVVLRESDSWENCSPERCENKKTGISPKQNTPNKISVSLMTHSGQKSYFCFVFLVSTMLLIIINC